MSSFPLAHFSPAHLTSQWSGFASTSLRQLAALVLISSLTACSSIASKPEIPVSVDGQWALLPITNLSSTPLAGAKAKTMIETVLRKHGVQRIEPYPEPVRTSLVALLDHQQDAIDATAWSRSGDFRYALDGTIHEWEYKGGADREPVTALTLKLTDLTRGDVVWQATSSRTGWGYAGLSEVGNRLIEDMLKQLRFQTSH